MPPKAKHTREDIIKAGLCIAQKNGIEAVTAASIGAMLGTSVSSVFTHFETVEEIRREVKKEAMEKYTANIRQALSYSPAFRQFFAETIGFALKQPQIFKMLFLEKVEGADSASSYFPTLGEPIKICISGMKQDYLLDEREARYLFDQSWIYCIGLCTLLINGVFGYHEKELEELLGRQFQATYGYIKDGGLQKENKAPEKKERGKERK